MFSVSQPLILDSDPDLSLPESKPSNRWNLIKLQSALIAKGARIGTEGFGPKHWAVRVRTYERVMKPEAERINSRKSSPEQEISETKIIKSSNGPTLKLIELV